MMNTCKVMWLENN